MIKIGNNTITMPPGTVKVCVGDIKVWPPYDDDLIIITRNDYAIGWTNADTNEVEVGYRRKALPEGYTELEYVTVAGGTLGNTGWKTNGTSIIEARILKEDTPSAAYYLWRTATASSAGSGRVTFTMGVNGGNCIFGNQTIVAPAADLRDGIVTIRQDITGIYANNNLLAAYTNPTVTTSTETLKWGTSGDSTTDTKYYYFFHIRDDIVRTFYIPCIQNSDNKVGFYNLASEVFIEMGTAGPIKHQ